MRGSITKRTLKDGTVVYDIVLDTRTGGEKRRQKRVRGFKSRKEAEAALAGLIHEVEKGTYLEPEKATLGEYLEEWLKAHALSVSPRTLANYALYVREHIIPAIGHIPLAKLRPLHIQRFVASLMTGGRKDKRKLPALSPTTVRHVYTTLHKALADAVKWQLVPYNPASGVTAPKRNRKECAVLDKKDIPRLLEAFSGGVMEMPVFLGITTGMRLGEILALRWEDVDLAGGKIHVRRSLSKNRLNNQLEFKEPKTTKSRRTVEIGPEVVARLKKHKARQLEMRLAAGPRWKEHGLVCCRGDGTPIDPSTASARFSKAAEKLRLRLGFHDLRHTHATLLLQSNVNPKIISERLGHAAVSITLDLYSHILPGMQAPAVQAVEGLLSEAGCDQNVTKRPP